MNDQSEQDGAPARPGVEAPNPDRGGQGDGLAKRLAVISVVTVVVLLGVVAYLVTRGGDDDPEPLTTATTEPTNGQPGPSDPSPTDSAPVDGGETELTEVQKQAAADARFAIDIGPDSRAGLIEHLTFLEYSEADATIAVDSLDIDWDLQATLAAENAVEDRAVSKPGLVDYLSSDAVGFTDDQANAAVDALDVDWEAQPERYARDYAEGSAVSRSRLVFAMTESEGFTEEEAEQGIDAANIDFNKEAADAAEKHLVTDPTLTCEELIDRLSGKISDGFTVEEATYGAGTTQTCIDPEPTVPTTTHAPVSPGDWTPKQHEAYDDAKQTLVKAPVSRGRLIEVLIEEYRHSEEDAAIVVDSLRINWNNQAVRMSSRSLQFWPYSKQGLIEALQGDFFQFTEEQATFGGNTIEVDWDANAVERAELLLETMDDPTCEAVVEFLTDSEYFTPEQAQHGADEVGIC